MLASWRNNDKRIWQKSNGFEILLIKSDVMDVVQINKTKKRNYVHLLGHMTQLYNHHVEPIIT